MRDTTTSMNKAFEAMIKTQKNTIARVSTAATFDSLSYDIINEIFEHAGMCGSVCLGLTCRKLYAFLKIRNPRPIPLFQFICDDKRYSTWRDSELMPNPSHSNCNLHRHVSEDGYVQYRDCLSDLLEDWAAPCYRAKTIMRHIPSASKRERPEKEFVHYFWRIEAFGEWYNESDAGKIHIGRYEDYNDSVSFGLYRGLDRELTFQLPWPYNMGNAWDQEAVDTIVKAIPYFRSIDHWRYFFGGLHIFSRKREVFDKVLIEMLRLRN